MSRATRGGLVVASALAALGAASGPAAAAGHTCQLSEVDALEIDGAFDDWRGYPALRSGPAGDAEVQIRCGYDDRALYLAIEVVDDALIRTRQARVAGEDHATVSLTADSTRAPLVLRVLPGGRGAPRAVAGLPRGAALEDTLTERGYAVELSVPWSRLAGFGRSTPSLYAEVLVHDADRATARAIEDVVGLRGRLDLSSHLPAYRGFLAATRLSPRDLKVDRLLELDGAAGSERLVAGGRFVGVLSDEFVFVELPAAGADDVLAVEPVDLEGTGRWMVLSHSRQRGANGMRELVAVWRLGGRGLERAFAAEVAQELDGRLIRNRWTRVPAGTAGVGKGERGEPRRGAQDLLLEVGEVRGWTAADYANVAPSTDVTPLLTPFGGPTAVVYGFEAEAVIGPIVAKRSPAARRR